MIRIGVALATLLAVATVLIAPNVDLPETVLHEVHRTAAGTAFHPLEKLDHAALSHFAFMAERWTASDAVTHTASSLRLPSRPAIPLRC